jgi:hypothetical protein
MLRQSIVYLVLSVLIVVFAAYVHLLIVYIDMLYVFINVKLAPIFSHSATGILIRQILVLTLLPLLVVGIPALIYRSFKKQQMPYFFEILWLLWLILVLSKILIH